MQRCYIFGRLEAVYSRQVSIEQRLAVKAEAPVSVIKMQIAYNLDGKPTEAAQYAPSEAHCPHCGSVVTLRRRRLMVGRGVVYYWLHRANENRRCLGRFRPVGR